MLKISNIFAFAKSKIYPTWNYPGQRFVRCSRRKLFCLLVFTYLDIFIVSGCLNFIEKFLLNQEQKRRKNSLRKAVCKRHFLSLYRRQRFILAERSLWSHCYVGGPTTNNIIPFRVSQALIAT